VKLGISESEVLREKIAAGLRETGTSDKCRMLASSARAASFAVQSALDTLHFNISGTASVRFTSNP
jgi:hypothetical protein